MTDVITEQTTPTGDRNRAMLDSLLAEIDGAGLDVDLEIVERAFAYAAVRHKGQKRKSGVNLASGLRNARVSLILRLAKNASPR